VFAAGKQAVNEIAADKTGGPGDKNFFHDWTRSLMRAGRASQHFWRVRPANITTGWFRFTLPQLIISVTEDKKYNSLWQISS
jgi:hypothetical protein